MMSAERYRNDSAIRGLFASRGVTLIDPMRIVTRPQDWAEPAREILWPALAAERQQRHQRE